MAKAADWDFTKRFRRCGFGWRASWLASERIAETLAEIHVVACHDPSHERIEPVRLGLGPLEPLLLLGREFIVVACSILDGGDELP